MTSFALGSLLGLFIGTFFGLLAAGLARAATDADAPLEQRWGDITAADRNQPMPNMHWTW